MIEVKKMEIREPKFKVGDKVYCKQYKSSAIITGVAYYSFNKDKYFYNVEWEHDGYLDEIHEDLSEPYIEKPKSVFDLKEGDTYYSIYGNGNVSSEKKWFDDDYENNYREIGNCFLTKEEAETEVERRKIEVKMLRLGGRRNIKICNDNYYITYDHKTRNLAYLNRNWMHSQGIIFFDTYVDVDKAVKAIGEDRIKKYIFGVEE